MIHTEGISVALKLLRQHTNGFNVTYTPTLQNTVPVGSSVTLTFLSQTYCSIHTLCQTYWKLVLHIHF